MTAWREWELSKVWASSAVCPDCGEPLIITHLISAGTPNYDGLGSDTHNGICPHCRKQYTVLTDAGTLTPNLQASSQQDRIDALEERVAKLEAIVHELMKRQSVPTRPPIQNQQAQKEETQEAQDFRKKYGYLL